MLPVICLVVICGGAFALPTANQYIDNVLHTTLQNVIRSEKLDPTHLPDYTFEYTDKTFFGKVHGKAEYTEGSLVGLSQVIRDSDCHGPANVSGSTFINCTIVLSSLSTSYKGKVKYSVFPKVTIDAKGNTSRTLLNVAIAKGFNEQQARVRSFNLVNFRTLDTHFTGLGPLNKHMEVLERNYKEKVTADVRGIVQNRFQYALNLAVGQVPMPLR